MAVLVFTAWLASATRAPADSVPGVPAPAPKLQWQVHQTAAKRGVRPASSIGQSSGATPVEKAVWQARGHAANAVPAVSTSPRPPRPLVVQTSADKADAFSDPFEDEQIPNVTTDDVSSQTSQPATTPESSALPETPLAPDSSTSPAAEPPLLDGGRDPLQDQTPPDLREGLEENEPALPGLAPPIDASCDKYKANCDEAVRRLRDRDITKIIFGIVIEGEGGRPPVEGADYPCECVLGENATFLGRNWAPTTFTWKASGTCFKPLYFQDVQLERYGHSWNPLVQPFMSAAHFFVSVPLLPYKMGLNPPNECVYTLGYYRPGSCAPYMIEPIPLSLRAATFEALGATAFGFWFWPPPTGP
jgi:hypothetical protein